MASENAGNSGTPASGESVANEPSKTGVPATRQLSDATATGQQIASKMGKESIPKGKERGSQVKIEGGDPTPDAKGPQKPRGLQAEDALFTSNGSIPADQVPSPSGLQPVAAVATSPEHAKKLVATRVKEHEHFVEHGHASQSASKRLDEATINRLSKTELRAIGQQRGYSMPDSGTRSSRAAFIAGQNADKTLGGRVGQNSGKQGSKGGGRGASQQGRGTGDKSSTNAATARATRRAAPKGQAGKGSRSGRGSR